MTKATAGALTSNSRASRSRRGRGMHDVYASYHPGTWNVVALFTNSPMIRNPVRVVGLTALFAGLFLAIHPAHAQYFGRNKVQYDQFYFQVFKTENFEFYLYPEEELAVRDASRMAERWYQRHSRTFLREFAEPKPISIGV